MPRLPSGEWWHKRGSDSRYNLITSKVTEPVTSSYLQQPLILLEPLSSALVIRHDLSDLLPELLRMVRLADMDQFMDNYIINNLRGGLDQAPAEVESSLVGA